VTPVPLLAIRLSSLKTPAFSSGLAIDPADRAGPAYEAPSTMCTPFCSVMSVTALPKPPPNALSGGFTASRIGE
jgi:hypothetical protein